jgi:3-oxoacyl-[acyl-carrier protein] reductase
MNLHHKTVAITGAAQGIGRALALEFAAAGSDLALIDLQPERLEETQNLVRAHGVTARAYAANVADETQVEAIADRIVGDFGRFDGIVNNAGILRDALLVKVRDGAVTGRMSLEQWRAVIDVNLTGVFLCGRAAAERMSTYRAFRATATRVSPITAPPRPGSSRLQPCGPKNSRASRSEPVALHRGS